jgi:hypothetical protein
MVNNKISPISIPRAAISVATKTLTLPALKSAKARVRAPWDLLPWMAAAVMPFVPEDYVHRIGRTGRAGSKGEAISLVSADEAKQLFDIERLTQKKLERIMVDDCIPSHDVPDTGKGTLGFIAMDGGRSDAFFAELGSNTISTVLSTTKY